jgi:hypothetical protein
MGTELSSQKLKLNDYQLLKNDSDSWNYSVSYD